MEGGRDDEPPAKKIRVESPADTQPKEPLGLVCHHFDPPPLPPDWVAVPHISGATVYLHRPTRVVTLSRPYHVSTSNAIKKHSVFIQSIPCLEQWLFGKGEQSQLAQQWHTRVQGKEQRLKKIVAGNLKEYLSLRWDSDQLTDWEGQEVSAAGGDEGEREEGMEGMKKGEVRKQKRKHSPLVPEGLSQLVSVQIPGDYRKTVDHPEGKKPPTVWEVNMANKNSIVLLYEFCQIYLHTSPDFSFTQSKGPPYQCVVRVGRVRYGSGEGTNKKTAKLAAASQALELFLPGAFSDKLTPAGSAAARSSEEGLQLLSQVVLDDPNAPTILAQTGFPSPWQTLKSALQWNQGFLSDKLTLDLQPLPVESHTPSDHPSSAEVPPGHQFECVLRCGEEGEGGGEGVKEVRVTCTGKKDGQAAAAQAMLKELHPYITNWGSLLKLYSHPPPTAEPPPLPPSVVAEGCGLLSGADQQLLHSLRQAMTSLAQQRTQQEQPETLARSATSQLHQYHIHLSSSSLSSSSSS